MEVWEFKGLEPLIKLCLENGVGFVEGEYFFRENYCLASLGKRRVDGVPRK